MRVPSEGGQERVGRRGGEGKRGGAPHLDLLDDLDDDGHLDNLIDEDLDLHLLDDLDDLGHLPQQVRVTVSTGIAIVSTLIVQHVHAHAHVHVAATVSTVSIVTVSVAATI